MDSGNETLCHLCDTFITSIQQLPDAADGPRTLPWHKTTQQAAESAPGCVFCHHVWCMVLQPIIDEALERYTDLLQDVFPIGIEVRYKVTIGALCWVNLVTEANIEEKGMTYLRVVLVGFSSEGGFSGQFISETEAERRISQIREWLRVCSSDHPECNPKAASPSGSCLPKRLLEIPPDGTVRLVATENLTEGCSSEESIHYATLSYCWGGSVPILTTTKTQKQFEAGLLEEALPKTFQDAIRIVRALEIRYLWIDALCIVQNDYDDWQQEAGKMMDIYFGSTITLAASDSTDSTGGCLPVHRPSSALEPAIEFPTQNNFTQLVNDKTKLSVFPVRLGGSEAELMARLQVSTPWLFQRGRYLSTRGWTFQEQILSHRVVHCMESEMHWQCRRLYKTQEGYQEPALLSGTSMPLAVRDRTQDQERLWSGWVEEYSQRDFTYPSDRLSALYGVICYYQRITGHTPLLGLWAESIARDLLWVRLDKIKNPTLDRMPSWTWLSIDSMAKVDIWAPGAANLEDNLKLVHWAVDWEGKPFMSPIARTELQVRGRTTVLRLRITPAGAKFHPPYMEMEGEQLDASRAIPWTIAGQFDQEDWPTAEFDDYTCLLLRTRRTKKQDDSWCSRGFLILKKMEDRLPSGRPGVGVYRRVGVGHVTGQSTPFDDANAEELELV